MAVVGPSIRLFILFTLAINVVFANKTATWLDKRAKLIGSVYGKGDGVLPTQSVPTETLTYPSDPGPESDGWRARRKTKKRRRGRRNRRRK
jgi:hypothetical protein